MNKLILFLIFLKKSLFRFFRGVYKYGRQLELFDKKNSKKAGQERSVPSSLWCCVRGYDGPPAATAWYIIGTVSFRFFLSFRWAKDTFSISSSSSHLWPPVAAGEFV
jgi:hypothetical protein